jgi:hypothetical protein
MIFSLVVSAFWLISLVLLAVLGKGDAAFVALFVMWCVLTVLQWALVARTISYTRSIAEDKGVASGTNLLAKNVWELFIGSMVLLGTHGKDDPSLAPVLSVVAALHVIVVAIPFLAACAAASRGRGPGSPESVEVKLLMRSGVYVLLFVILHASFLLFISAMVLVGKYGRSDPTFVAVMSAWGATIAVWLAVVTFGFLWGRSHSAEAIQPTWVDELQGLNSVPEVRNAQQLMDTLRMPF